MFFFFIDYHEANDQHSQNRALTPKMVGVTCIFGRLTTTTSIAFCLLKQSSFHWCWLNMILTNHKITRSVRCELYYMSKIGQSQHSWHHNLDYSWLHFFPIIAEYGLFHMCLALSSISSFQLSMLQSVHNFLCYIWSC